MWCRRTALPDQLVMNQALPMHVYGTALEVGRRRRGDPQGVAFVLRQRDVLQELYVTPEIDDRCQLG